MKEIKVKIFENKIPYRDKKDGSPREIESIALEFPNGMRHSLVSTRFTYRLYDYLKDLIKGGE